MGVEKVTFGEEEYRTSYQLQWGLLAWIGQGSELTGQNTTTSDLCHVRQSQPSCVHSPHQAWQSSTFCLQLVLPNPRLYKGISHESNTDKR